MSAVTLPAALPAAFPHRSRLRRPGPAAVAFAVVLAAVAAAPIVVTPVRTTVGNGSPAALPAVTLTPVDGGAYANGLGSIPRSLGAAWFPIGVWQEVVLTQDDVDMDRAAGLNTYVLPVNGTDLSLIRAAGSIALTDNGTGDGAFVTDEADMWGGAGSAPWTGRYPGQGDICAPATAACGYTVMRRLAAQVPANQLSYANYGKGVTFWQSDADAGRFVNDYQDIVSADNYWFSDDNICGQYEGGGLVGGGSALSPAACHLASNYGATVRYVRSLVKPARSKPVWAFVELGHPFTYASWPSIRPPQVRSAVWASIIAGARGIVYFNHSFGGPCQTQHALREDCYRAVRTVVTGVDAQIRSLAPVLNGPTVNNAIRSTPGVDVLTKAYRGGLYVIAGANRGGTQSITFTTRCGGTTAAVLGENRTVRLGARGGFTDTFAGPDAVHLYRIDGGGTCGAA